MMNKASCLSFVSNAMVLWNTEQMQKVYEILNQKGFKAGNEDMARVLPLSTKNILVHGQYNFLKCKLKESLYVITCYASYHG
jgi:Tn3 transposase DDE domain-containing protein